MSSPLKFVLAGIIFGIIGIANPTWAESGTVVLGGEPLFELQDTTDLTGQERADYVNYRLKEILDRGAITVVRVWARPQGGVPVILIQNNYLFTVTGQDALGEEPEPVAKRWSLILEQRLNQALAERAPQRISQGVALAVGLLGLGSGLLALVRWLDHRIQRRLAVAQATRGILIARLLFPFSSTILQVLISGLALFFAAGSIPPWRPWLIQLGNQFQEVLRSGYNAFSTPFLTLGSSTKLSLGLILQLLVLGVFILWAAQTFRAWLRQGVLRQLELDPGSQEAVATVAFYSFLGIGFVALLQSNGIDLSSLTVFAGVLGIGIGFGLQNIASNFISGITILLEQPIKVGDFIEVDGLLGTVARISVRSTTIQTLDGISIIVPNSTFIQNNVINWSYRDPTSRIHLSIGVAYGSDLALVTEALLRAARRESLVLKEPAPQVWFRQFGESSLDFELLFWISRPQTKEMVRSALNYLIDEEFRQQAIEVPFPQRDLHLRSGLEHFTQGGVPPSPVPHVIQRPNLRDLLRRVSFFKACTDSELRVLIEQGYQESFPTGTVICRQGAPGTSFYIILEGEVGVMAEPDAQLLAKLPEGAFCGEIALLTGTNRTATLTALSDTVLFVIDQQALTMLLSQHQALAEQISQTLATRVEELKQLGLFTESVADDSVSRPDLGTQVRNRIRQIFGI